MSITNGDLICINCMREKSNAGICPHCGFDEGHYEPAPHHLPPRSILAGKFLLGRVLCEDAFGITYMGWDLNLDLKLAIKEYYPAVLVTRTSTTTTSVTPFYGEKTDFFTSGRSRFVNQAKTLAKFYNLPGLVSVRDFFLENSTAYIVTEFVKGETLNQRFAHVGGKMPVDTVFDLMRPLLRSLSEIHAAGYFHRDIGPDSIMITPEGNAKLIGFGAARDDLDSGNRRLPMLFHPGYSPEEQYFASGQQGSWTDVYALCATIYRAITGVTPPESIERLRHDELQAPSKLGVEISPMQEAALLKGMAVSRNDRWQNIPELFAALYPKDGHAIEVQLPELVNREEKPNSTSNHSNPAHHLGTKFTSIRKQVTVSFARFMKHVFNAAKDKLFPKVAIPSSGNQEDAAAAITQQKRTNKRRAIILGVSAFILLLGIFTVSMFTNKESALEKVDALEFDEAVELFHRIPFGDKLFPEESAYVSAAELVVNQEYSAAESAFTTLGQYRRSSDALNEVLYQEGLLYITNRDYKEAATAFDRILSYRDASEQHTYAQYLYASDLALNGREDEALSILSPLDAQGYHPAKVLTTNIYKSKATRLAAAGAYGRAYQTLLLAQGSGDVSDELAEYREKAYNAGVNLYRLRKYIDAKSQFKNIGSYLATNDYIYLINLHTVLKNFSSDPLKTLPEILRLRKSSATGNEVDLKKLIPMIGFEDAADFILFNQRSAVEFLTGYWKGDGCYFKMAADGHTRYNLPYPNYGDYYEIKDGTMVFYPADDSTATRDAFEFTILSEGCIEIFAFENCRTYTLYRS